MADERANFRKEAWTPPPRPEWVRRLNEEGGCIDIDAIVPLDADSLMQAAIASTGLSDFGADDWRGPFEIFLKSLKQEANLNLMGRIMTRSDLVGYLEARLHVEAMYRQHPEIDDVEIKAPIWIFGLGRSGTSNLQKLLALDPDNRSPCQWEVMFPTADADNQTMRALADRRATQWGRVTPEIIAMHDFGGDEPAESIMFEAMSFRCPAWLNLLGIAPTFTQAMAKEPYDKSFQYAKRVFKLLEWKSPGKRWVFKSPDSIHYLPELLKVFPDIRLVWTHRDPIKTMSSAVSLVGTLTFIRSDTKIPTAAFEAITAAPAVAASLKRPIGWLADGVLPGRQLCNLLYEDLIADPLSAVGKIYEHFDIPFTAEARRAIGDHVAAYPRQARAKHAYFMGDEVSIRAERSVFKPYTDYFQVPIEA